MVELIQDWFLLALRHHAAREAARDYSPIQENPGPAADRKFKAPLQRSLLRRTGLVSGPSLSPPARNPPVGRPGRQPDGRLPLNLRPVPTHARRVSVALLPPFHGLRDMRAL